MLSINRKFRPEWGFSKSTGRLFVSDNWVFLDSGGFSVLCSYGRFVIWPVDATDILFEFVLIGQLLLRGMRYGFLFEIDRTLIW